MYAYCRADKQGCGETTYIPPMGETCRRVSFGYEGTSWRRVLLLADVAD